MSTKTRPNINTKTDYHKQECYLVLPGEFLHPGCVKRCRHGKIFLAVNVVGLGSAQWTELSPLFNPIRYYRAKKAIRDWNDY